MNVDSVNDPTNKLNLNITESIKGANKFIIDPFFRVILYYISFVI